MRKGGNLFTSLCIFLCALALVPSITQAAFGEADAFCATACLPFWQKKPMQPCVMVCTDTTNTGITTGKCNPMPPGKCIGTGFSSPDGDMKGAGDIGKFLEQAMGMLKDLMKPKEKGGGGEQGGGAGYNPQQQYPTCVHNAATKTVSPVPCTEANGQINYGGTSLGDLTAGGGSIGNSTADALLNALNGTTNNSTSGTNTNTSTTTSSASTTSSGTGAATSAASSTQVTILSAQQGTLTSTGNQGVLQGDVIVGQSGGMLYARSRDPGSNTEVAGFYGGNSFGQAQSLSLIGSLCSRRPWGNGIISGLISGGFFDNLCNRFGYQVGAIVVTPGSGAVTASKRPKVTITQNPAPRPATTTAPVQQPEVDIWANPPSVRLGTRTYIFWNTRSVESCVEAGPNFSHNTLSGGASTVPLSDASVFTIECKTPDGKTVRDTVRVNLSL